MCPSSPIQLGPPYRFTRCDRWSKSELVHFWQIIMLNIIFKSKPMYFRVCWTAASAVSDTSGKFVPLFKSSSRSYMSLRLPQSVATDRALSIELEFRPLSHSDGLVLYWPQLRRRTVDKAPISVVLRVWTEGLPVTRWSCTRDRRPMVEVTSSHWASSTSADLASSSGDVMMNPSFNVLSVLQL